jgi:hypothetical protein
MSVVVGLWCLKPLSTISVVSWLSVLLLGKTGIPGENHQPVASRWQNSSHHVGSSIHLMNGVRTRNVRHYVMICTVVVHRTTLCPLWDSNRCVGDFWQVVDFLTVYRFFAHWLSRHNWCIVHNDVKYPLHGKYSQRKMGVRSYVSKGKFLSILRWNPPFNYRLHYR